MVNTKNVKKMEIPNSILSILKRNHWDEFNFKLMEQTYLDKLEKYYSKYDYPMTDTLLKRMALFYNMKLRFETGSEKILYFDAKKINKYRQAFLNSQAEKFKVKKVVYLGDIHPGYITIWIDENEKIWGDYDNIIYLYGSNLFDGVENILKNRFDKKSCSVFFPNTG